MKKLLFKRTFAGRVSAYIIALIMIVFCVVMVSFYKVAREKIIDSSVRHSASMLTNMSQQIDAQLQSVAHSIDNTAWIVEANIGNTDLLMSLLQRDVKSNPLIVGAIVAVEPSLSKQKELKMLYALKNDDGTITKIIKEPTYYYPDMNWYKIPLQLKQSYWSEPYVDGVTGKTLVTTYSKPLINSDGEVYAIYSADVSLLHFSDLVEKIQPFPDSYSFMLSRKGYYITHHKRERILHETIFTRAVADSNYDYEQIGRSMTSGESGSRMFENDLDRSYAIYTPVSNTGWSICNVGKQDVLLANLNAATHSIIIIFIIGIFCLFLCTTLIIKRLMKPLEGFALSAKEIAHGNFEAHLPEIKSEDEMKTLHDSFAYMQQSLVTYIAELKQSTASKERIESELNIAHKIQMGMLPRIFPLFSERADVDLYAILKPAKEVGGDLYDFFILDEKLYFTIGDVSGKGVPASLFMAVTRTLFRNISRSTLSSEEIIDQMNESMTQQNDSSMFVTLFVGILNLQNGKFNYCNAGHNPPVLVTSDGTTTLLKPKKNQLAVGIFSETVYTSESTTLESGTKLFCYTDGIVEAENAAQELYREDRLMKTLSVHHQCDVKHLTEQVLESVAEHVLDADQSDDLTVLVIKYKK